MSFNFIEKYQSTLHFFFGTNQKILQQLVHKNKKIIYDFCTESINEKSNGWRHFDLLLIETTLKHGPRTNVRKWNYSTTKLKNVHFVLLVHLPQSYWHHPSYLLDGIPESRIQLKICIVLVACDSLVTKLFP